MDIEFRKAFRNTKRKKQKYSVPGSSRRESPYFSVRYSGYLQSIKTNVWKNLNRKNLNPFLVQFLVCRETLFSSRSRWFKVKKKITSLHTAVRLPGCLHHAPLLRVVSIDVGEVRDDQGETVNVRVLGRNGVVVVLHLLGAVSIALQRRLRLTLHRGLLGDGTLIQGLLTLESNLLATQ